MILTVGDRVFHALSANAVRKVLHRESQAGVDVRLLDSTWEWFDMAPDVGAIAPSLLDRLPPTKQSVIALVNGRSNRAPGAPLYQARSLSSRTRQRVFAELLALLPAG